MQRKQKQKGEKKYLFVLVHYQNQFKGSDTHLQYIQVGGGERALLLTQLK